MYERGNRGSLLSIPAFIAVVGLLMTVAGTQVETDSTRHWLFTRGIAALVGGSLGTFLLWHFVIKRGWFQ